MLKRCFASLVLSLVALVAGDRPASACGGCFRPSQIATVVNAHRMVFSVSQQQTILWDQFTYTGNPSEFAWVLPVHSASVKVELAHDEFIAALDAWTVPQIIAPAQSSGGGGFGCGSSAVAYNGGGGNGVQVINQQVVGPYEVATLASTDPNALDNWLTQHGYDIPDSIKPTIAAYVNESFDFIALRLLPGQGVAAMQPVRVTTAGADPTLPLRMVAAGVGSDVAVLLYVISEGRYEAANFNNTEVDFSKLVWSKNATASNYDTLVQNAMTSGDGRNFTVEFAGHLFSSDFTSTFHQAFSNLYEQGVYAAQKCPYTQVHGSDFPSDAGVTFADASLPDDAAAVDASGADASTGDSGTLGQPYDTCKFDDLTAATLGMNHNDVFVTRLRANLKVAALSKDLAIQAAADQRPYDNIHNASQTGDGCQTADGAPDRSVVFIGLGAIAVVLAARRRRA